MWSVVFAMVFAFGPATIHIDSTGWVTSAANLPSVISTDEVFWTWSFPCAPQRFTDGVLASCIRTSLKTIRITDAARHPIPNASVRWGTAAMIRELPDSLLPEVSGDDQGLVQLMVPDNAELFARAAGPKWGGFWTPISAKQPRVDIRAEASIDLDILVTDTAGQPARRSRLALQTFGLAQPEALTIHDRATDGRIRIQGIPRVALMELTAWSEELLPRIVSGKAGALPRTLILQRGATITALVSDAQKKPIANARAEMIVPLGDGHSGIRRAAESDQSGHFELHGAPPGRVSWKVAKRSWTPVVRTDDLRAGENPIGVVLMSRGRDVAVAVVDEAEHPVSNAGVQTTDGAVRTQTNAKGIAIVGSIPLDRNTEVVVKASGFLTQSVEIAKDRKGPLKVRLERGVSVSARLISSSSRQPAGPGSVFIKNNDAKFTRTIDASGVVDIGGLQEGSLSLEIRADSFPPYRMAPRNVRKNERIDLGTISLAAGLSIEGIVVDARSGAPLQAARIRSPRIHKEGPRLARVLNDYVECLSDDTGHFSLNGFLAGDYRIVVEARDHAPYLVKNISLRDDMVNSSLDLGTVAVPEAHTLEVRCTPAVRCGDRIDAIIGGDDEDWAALHASIADGHGFLVAVPPGDLVVRLSGRNVEIAEKPVEISASQDSTMVSFNISAVQVNGEVSQSGRKVSGGEVRFVSSNRGSAQIPIFVTHNSEYGSVASEVVGSLPQSMSAPVDADGHFSIADLSPGPYRVRYQSAASGESSPKDIVVPDTEIYPMRIDLAGADVGGAIVDDKGATPLWCSVRITDAQGLTHTTTAEADGRFSLIGLPVGRASIRAWNDESEDKQDIELREGERRDVRLVLKASDSRRTITVLDPTGRPVRSAAVFLASGADLHTEVTDGEGVATFRGLDPKERAAVGAYGAGLGWAFSTCGDSPVAITLSGIGGVISIQAERMSPVAIVTPQGFPLHRALSLLGLHTAVRPTGPFALGGLPDGDYTVDVGGKTQQARVTRGASFPLHF